MEKIFLDTNILLDVLLERHPYCLSAQHVWSLAERKKVRAAVSATSLNNIFFIVKRLSSQQKAYQAIRTIFELFKILDVKSQTISEALRLQPPDFEDAIQYCCALAFRSQVILTRDPAGFSGSEIPVMDCDQYLAGRE